MADEASMARVALLLEKQIALDLYFRGVSQNTIAKVLQKSKTWVNELLQGVPKRSD